MRYPSWFSSLASQENFWLWMEWAINFKFVFILQKCMFEWNHLLVAHILPNKWYSLHCFQCRRPLEWDNHKACKKNPSPMGASDSHSVGPGFILPLEVPVTWKDLLLLTRLFYLCISSGIWNRVSNKSNFNCNFGSVKIQNTKPTWLPQGSEKNAPLTQRPWLHMEKMSKVILVLFFYVKVK